MFPDKKPLLSVHHIVKKYGSHLALNDVSLDLYPGEIVCLLGVNGAGKTTLSSIIATIISPTQGDVLFNGQSIYNDIPSYRRSIGLCQQKPNLNGLLSLYDNLYFHGCYYGMQDAEIRAQIKKLSDQFYLEPYLRRMSFELSGGYAQRFMLARGLFHNPQILILDEPTVALDPHVRRQIWDYIKQLRDSGITVLLTTHYLDEAEALADRICLLHHGVVKLIDTPSNLMQTLQKGSLEEVFIGLTQEL